MFDTLESGNVVIGDRYYCGWFMIARLQQRGVDMVTRLHKLRRADFRRGCRLGPGDHTVQWPMPPRPDWLDQSTYDSLPEELAVREIEVTVDVPGFRTESLVVVATLRDAHTYSREAIASLYRERWFAELDLGCIKSSMQLDILRCKTPEMVRVELQTGILAYNLIRQSMQAAVSAQCLPRELSFTSAMQSLANNWVTAGVCDHVPQTLIDLIVSDLSSHKVGNRPNRVEPRAVKRRPSQYDHLAQPRREARATLTRNRSS